MVMTFNWFGFNAVSFALAFFIILVFFYRVVVPLFQDYDNSPRTKKNIILYNVSTAHRSFLNWRIIFFSIFKMLMRFYWFTFNGACPGRLLKKEKQPLISCALLHFQMSLFQIKKYLSSDQYWHVEVMSWKSKSFLFPTFYCFKNQRW